MQTGVRGRLLRSAFSSDGGDLVAAFAQDLDFELAATLLDGGLALSLSLPGPRLGLSLGLLLGAGAPEQTGDPAQNAADRRADRAAKREAGHRARSRAPQRGSRRPADHVSDRAGHTRHRGNLVADGGRLAESDLEVCDRLLDPGHHADEIAVLERRRRILHGACCVAIGRDQAVRGLDLFPLRRLDPR